MIASASSNTPNSLNTKYWWVQILLGIVFIGLSIWFYLTPLETYISLAVFFSYLMLITGIFEIPNALAQRNDSQGWIISLLVGIIDLGLGIYLITHELLTMEVLPIILGFWFIFRALAFFISYGQLKKKKVKNSGWLLVIALLTLLFAIAILARPVIGELTLVFTISFAFFFMGLFRLTLGNELRKANK